MIVRSINKQLCFIVMFLALSFGASQQFAQKVDDPCLKTLEQTVDALKEEKIKSADLAARLAISEEKSKLKDDKLAFALEKADFYKRALEDYKKTDKNSTSEIVNLKSEVTNLRIEVSNYKDENNSLRFENGKLRSSRNFTTILGYGAGVATGFFIKR